MQKMVLGRLSRTQFKSAVALTLLIAAPTLAQTAPRKAVPPTIAAKAIVADRAMIKQRLDGMQRLWPVMLDLSKPADRAFYLAINRVAGRTIDNNPEFAKFTAYTTDFHRRRGAPRDPHVFLTTDGRKVDATGAVTDFAVGPVTNITSFQPVPTGGLATSALVSLPGQPQTCTQTLQIFDEQGNPQGAADTVTQVLACENVQLYATGALDAGDQWAKAVLTTNWIDQGGNPFTLVSTAEGSNVPTGIVSTDPRDKTGDGMIKFCFGRTGADCDYAPANSSATNVILPLNGNTSYAGALVDPKSDSKASVYVSMSQPTPQAGGGCTLIANSAQFMQNYVTLSNNNQTVNWADPSISFPAINSACMPNGSVVYYNMMMNLDLAGTTPVPTFFGISSSPNTPISTGYYLQLAQTRVYYSCLAAGTLVDMADGSRRPIEEVRIGDMVRDGNGAAKRVGATYVGEEKQVVRITAGSTRLAVSEGHPIITDRGPRLAKFVRAGDRLRVRENGREHVVEVTAAAIEPYAGKVYNLRLDKGAMQVASANDADATFYGNGLLVGDNEVQWRYDRANATRDAAPSPPIQPAMSAGGKAALERQLGRPVNALGS